MSISPSVMSSIVATSGIWLTVTSANFYPKLFMAAANPELLMKLSRGGVGSLSIVATIIAMQIMSTFVIMNQFKIVNRKLDDIQKEMDQILLRQEITNIADVSSAIDVVDELFLKISSGALWQSFFHNGVSVPNSEQAKKDSLPVSFVLVTILKSAASDLLKILSEVPLSGKVLS